VFPEFLTPFFSPSVFNEIGLLRLGILENVVPTLTILVIMESFQLIRFRIIRQNVASLSARTSMRRIIRTAG